MKIVLTLFVLAIMSTVFSQNKKEQIEALNFSLDSLNNLIISERSTSEKKTNEINTLKKQIEILNKNEVVNQLENDRLKSELMQVNTKMTELSNQLEELKICNEFLNFRSYTSIKELNPLQACSPPSLLKADFYRYYYEVFLLTQIRSNFNVSNLSDIILLDLLKERRKSILSEQFDQKEESDILGIVSSLDRQFKTDNYSDRRTSITESFREMLENFYFNQLNNEYNIKVYDRFVLIFYNLIGAGTEGNVTSLYEIQNSTIKLINVYDQILSMIESKMIKYFGKDCQISRDFSITKLNGSYEVKCSVSKADEGICCGSGEIKFLTNDFLNYNSLMWGIKNTIGVVVNWKPI